MTAHMGCPAQGLAHSRCRRTLAIQTPRERETVTWLLSIGHRTATGGGKEQEVGSRDRETHTEALDPPLTTSWPGKAEERPRPCFLGRENSGPSGAPLERTGELGQAPGVRGPFSFFFFVYVSWKGNERIEYQPPGFLNATQTIKGSVSKLCPPRPQN